MSNDGEETKRRKRSRQVTLVDDGRPDGVRAAAHRRIAQRTAPDRPSTDPQAATLRTFLTHAQQAIEVTDGVGVVVGRDESCDFSLSDPYASRNHVCVKMRNGYPVIEDLGSSNGVLVNGERAELLTVLHHGDVLTIGRSLVTVARQRHAPKESPAAVPEWDGDGEFEDYESTLGGSGIRDTLESASWKALQHNDIHAAEVTAQRLFSGLKVGAAPDDWPQRALRLALSLSSQTSDAIWLRRAIALHTDLELLLGPEESIRVAELLRELGGRELTADNSALRAYLKMAGGAAHPSLTSLVGD